MTFSKLFFRSVCILAAIITCTRTSFAQYKNAEVYWLGKKIMVGDSIIDTRFKLLKKQSSSDSNRHEFLFINKNFTFTIFGTKDSNIERFYIDIVEGYEYKFRDSIYMLYITDLKHGRFRSYRQNCRIVNLKPVKFYFYQRKYLRYKPKKENK